MIAVLGMHKRRISRKGNLHGRIVINIHRHAMATPPSYEVTVSHHHGSAVWRERVLFNVGTYDAGRNIVIVSDMDYPDDRNLTLILNHEVDMPTFITNFIISGRW